MDEFEVKIEGKLQDQRLLNIEERSVGSAMSYDSMFVNPDPFLGGSEYEVLSPGDVIELNQRTFKVMKRLHRVPATEERLVYLVEENEKKYVAITNADNEHKVLEDLKQDIFPRIFGYDKETYQILVMEYVGENISSSVEKMCVKTLSSMVHDILLCFEKLLEKELCHRNVSVRTICKVDQVEEGKLDYTLIGFYLARKNMCENNHVVVMKNPVFCTLPIQEGEKYSYMDDLVSLLYVCSFLWNGKLPWDSTMKTLTIKEKKREFDLLKSLPEEMGDFWKAILDTSRDKVPNYSELIKLIKKTM